ncbi:MULTISPECIES: DUF4176 domain-containing protein [unclassified Ligilactobacillus]|uniref:DUF4176 domain-containing protein n=1 Tax=unclassified Ligilactobacillus TaxID=2767920 RepID=UPI00385220FD
MNIYPLGTIVRIKNILLMIVSWNVVDDEQYFEYGGVIYPKSLGSDVMLHCFNAADIDEVEGLIKKYREKQNNGDKNLLTPNFRLYV